MSNEKENRNASDWVLNIGKGDPERWFGVPAGYGTAVHTGFSGIIAFFLTAACFLVVYFAPDNAFRDMLLYRGPTQYAAVYLGLWCVTILYLKRKKLRNQKAALLHSVVPEEHDFVLTRLSADRVIRTIYSMADNPHEFIVLNRILTSLSSLKNLGRVSDVDDILRASSERDESVVHTSFATLGGFLWAIPVLGFIGTVLGLASAIGNFSSLLENQSDVSGIIGSLKEVTGGLSTAFETTLLALVIALFVQLWMTAQRKAEEVFLDECQGYCLREIVSRVKILPHEEEDGQG